jgi:hypothetical protein
MASFLAIKTTVKNDPNAMAIASSFLPLSLKNSNVSLTEKWGEWLIGMLVFCWCAL